jgi:uncharacterized membrane protein
MTRPSTRIQLVKPGPTSGQVSARQQRGAIALLAVFALLMAVTFAVLSLDAGRLWLERRSVQRAADMAALSASRFIGCGTRRGDGLLAAVEVAKANGMDGTIVTVDYGTLTPGPGGAPTFTPGASSENADAVRVQLSKSVIKSLLDGGMSQEKVLIPATAAAKGHAPVASFAINSVYGINEDIASATSGLFGAILGTSNLDLTPGSLEQLMKETVSLSDLMKVAPQFAKVEDLLTQTVTLQTMLNRVAGANPNIASNDAFKKILAASKNRPTILITLGNVVSVNLPTTIGVKEARINALDLLLTGVQVAGFKGGGLFNFAIPGGIFRFSVEMFSAPKLALGPAGRANNGLWCTTALSSQFSAKVGIDLSWLLGLADMVLRLDTGTVEGHLSSVAINQAGLVGNVAAQNASVTLVLTNNKDVNNPIIPDTFGPAKILGGLVGLKLYQPILAAKSVNTSFNAASKYDLPTAIKLGAGTAGQTLAGLLGDKSNFEVSIFWNLFKLRVDFLDDLVSFVMAPLGALLDGLLALFGIQTGNAYIQMRTIEMMPPTLVN